MTYCYILSFVVCCLFAAADMMPITEQQQQQQTSIKITSQSELTKAESKSFHADWKKDVFKTDEEAQAFVELIRHFANNKDVENLVKLRNWYMHSLYGARMKRCVRLLKFRKICDNNVGFYLWAQLLARDIINGSYQHDE